MDQTHDYSFQKQKPLSLSQFIKSQFLKRVIAKLILSVSVFSILFSHPTLHSCLRYFNFYFSTLPIKLFSHTLDKNCTFLLCNGLLVFLAKYSGLFSSSSSSSSSSKYNLKDHESFKNYEDLSQSQMMMETTDQLPLLEKEAVVENTETQQNAMEARESSDDYKSQEVLETETEKLTEEKHEEQEEEESRDVLEENEEPEDGSFFLAEAAAREEEEEEEEEEEREGGEGNGMLSTEELNKKFEDFIRKMKEELRIEARQQLIMV